MAGFERRLVAYIEIAQRAERRQVTDIDKGIVHHRRPLLRLAAGFVVRNDCSVGQAFSRLRKKSPFACFEGGLITAMKADLAGERAVWGAFGGASAEGGIHLVGTSQVKRTPSGP